MSLGLGHSSLTTYFFFGHQLGIFSITGLVKCGGTGKTARPHCDVSGFGFLGLYVRYPTHL